MNKTKFFYSFFSGYEPRAKTTTNSSEWESHVLPHSPIEELAPNIWHVTGIFPNEPVAPREMIIYKLPDSSLLIHSAICLDEPTIQQLESLGDPKIMIIPNPIHRLDAKVYKQRYPDLIVVTPAVVKPYAEQIVNVEEIAEQFLPQYGITCHQPAGINPQELAYELPLPTGKALIFTDILFNLTDEYLTKYVPKNKYILSWLGAAGFFGITFLGKSFFMNDRKAYRQWLEKLADTVQPLQIISVAHGEPITNNCQQKLREAAARLL
ncbi:hypothetical protein H6G06_19560 [Anabaena sphaerica FACHB-251]|uniref:DUF4336 domain-containing protein n=1 Tax=Anabaena sphaerica FACHB-251 TaxID=2692883 RepID=A0A927A3F5_9NOST|nr:hypothetical protein [Anabaena sphaerica]MBD2295610.1 hypothetical protein [Anabaena sphaerica FACHB-251]